MNKICFVIPYFGKFNNYFKLFLKSCEFNSDMCDWLIFTDDRTEYEYPKNVNVNYISWSDIKDLFQSKFDFPIKLEKAYKLCDFRVAYGYVFESYLKDYEFWGYCDVDLIWGKFSHFLTNDILNSYDKIFNFGHCTLYRNTIENNRVFLRTLNGEERYKDVFTNKLNQSFDEEYKESINSIYHEYSLPVYENTFAANIYTKSSDFKITKMNSEHNGYTIEKKNRSFFVWSNGVLKRYVVCRGELQQEEYLYAHFQSRKMDLKITNTSSNEFKIIPNAFESLEVPLSDISIKNIKNIKVKNFNLHYFKLRTKNLLIKIKMRFKRNI
jgi:hypothetical protein